MTNPLPLHAAMPGGMEWMLILAVVLLLFGNRIPGLARSLGSGINEFKAGLREGEKKPADANAESKESGPPAEKRS